MAYPVQARIEGASGPGAVRYCQFSTGDFVEPIEIWDAPRLLAFRVTHNPPPMRELTFHNNIQAPHLHGFREAERGQFRLIPLDGGAALDWKGQRYTGTAFILTSSGRCGPMGSFIASTSGCCGIFATR